MRSLGSITHLTIHCAATPEGRDVTAHEISAWDTAKFGQISYHKVVELDGTEVTTLADNVEGAHVHLHNSGNIGVCYIGGVDLHGSPKDTRTDAQKKTLRDIVARYRAAHPGLIVLGHKDWPNVHKACPSFDVGREL